MKNVKDLLKFASIINILTAALNMFFGSALLGIIYGAISIVLWVISEESDEKIASYRTFLTILGVILFFINIISSIFVMIAIGDIKKPNNINSINAPPKKIIKKVIDPEIKKIDILLKLGVGMVLISGILFVTTSWDSISIELKAIGLLALGCLFLSLSIFTEKRNKLYKTTYMYWLLSMSFFTLTIIGSLYFGIFNLELTYTGLQKELAYAITFLTISGLSLATYLKFSKDYLAYTSYFSILSMIWFFMNNFLPVETSIAIYSIILLVCNLINKKNKILLNITKIETYCSFLLILLYIKDSNSIMILISCIINMINLYYLSMIEKKESLIHLIVIYLLSIIGIFNLDLTMDTRGLFFFLYTTIHTIIISTNIVKQSQDYYHTNYILYSIASLITFFIVNINNKEIAFIIPVIYLSLNILLSMDIKSIHKIEYAPYLGPISILVLVYSIIQLFLTKETMIQYVIVSSTIVYCFINCIIKKENIKLL